MIFQKKIKLSVYVCVERKIKIILTCDNFLNFTIVWILPLTPKSLDFEVRQANYSDFRNERNICARDGVFFKTNFDI